MDPERGSIAFFSTYRPPVPLDIYSSPISPKTKKDEHRVTDGKSYSYNGQEIPSEALKTMLNHTKMGHVANAKDVDDGNVSGLVFVSERTNNLETLHIALRFHDGGIRRDVVYNFAQLYPILDKHVRMEDSACFAGERYIIYVSTKEPNPSRRHPWTAVYRTDLINGATFRLTPPGVADFSPSVSPNGRMLAMATLQFKKHGWDGEIEDLMSDIVVMDPRTSTPSNRKLVIKNGGWPTWATNDIIYFHRKTSTQYSDGKIYNKWGVFRANISDGGSASSVVRMTPANVDAMTPAAIDEYRVAVAIIRDRLDFNTPRDKPGNYRHIEVYDARSLGKPLLVTQTTAPMADHYNPFVIREECVDDDDDEDQVLIGYTRCNGDQLKTGDVNNQYDKVQTDDPEELGLFRVPGVFPTFTPDGQQLAFVDNDFQNVYLADTKGGLRVIFSVKDIPLLPPDERSVFSPVWNQNPNKDILYICVGPSFNAVKPVHIYAIYNASSTDKKQFLKLTTVDNSNNAFPFTNPEGTKIVFRSTRDWLDQPAATRHKNLYILEEEQIGLAQIKPPIITRITNGKWTDTHCQWSPSGKWIVFSSTRDKPIDAPPLDNGLDPGYFAVYLMKATDPSVIVRVISSGSLRAGHINHPMFSPDRDSLVFTADLAGVSIEPISMPLFIHSVRPYGDIFSVDIDPDDIYANRDLKEFERVTHSRYENSTPNWTMFTTKNLPQEWKNLFAQCHKVTWKCPYAGGAQTWQATGHLGLNRRCC